MTTAATSETPARLEAPTRISGAGAIVQTLKSLGVEVVFGYPGGTIMPTYDALETHGDGLRHVLVRHEQGAVHAAEGYARTTGQVGVCMATSGPGATNFITGLADALMDSTPLVCITGQVPGPMRGTDAFQEADVIGMTLGCTKWNCQVTRAADIPATLQTAFRVARAGRPGPVLVDITKDAQVATLVHAAPRTADDRNPNDAGAPCVEPGEHGCDHYGSWEYGPQFEDLSGIEAAAKLVNDAQRPLLLIGQGVLLAGAEREARLLAQLGQIPVAATLLGLSAIPTDHPQYVGMLGMHGNYAPNMLTNEADVIVAVGMRFDDRVTGRVDGYAPDARIVHIEIDPAEVNKVVQAEIALVGDARKALQVLLPHIEMRDRSAWRGRFSALEREETRAVITPALHPADGPLHMGEVVRMVSETTDGQAIVVSDVGQHQMFAARYYEFRDPLSHVTSGGLGTMGFALPAAVGAQLGNPHRTVVAIIGDGGFQMNIQELGTVMQEQVPVKLIILNNGYLGMVRQWQELFFDGRYSQVHMQSPDFVAVAAGYRIPAARVETREEAPAAIARLFATDGPALLEVVVGPEHNVFPMVAAGDAVSDIRLG